jgi:hypothetical protein
MLDMAAYLTKHAKFADYLASREKSTRRRTRGNASRRRAA